MSAVKSVCMTLCYASVAVAILSVMLPQKRTRRVMSFVVGLFFISTLLTAISAQLGGLELDLPQSFDMTIPDYSESDYQHEVAQLTADNLTAALNDLLQNEGIEPRDIRITLKISDEGRITVRRAVIYIDESSAGSVGKIKNIVYRNIAKEPEVYVQGEEAQRAAE